VGTADQPGRDVTSRPSVEEHRLEKEWSEEQTGTSFRAMRSEVRLGWLAKV
jgi:hypothetical protein